MIFNTINRVESNGVLPEDLSGSGLVHKARHGQRGQLNLD
jgi:hypothetical protein